MKVHDAGELARSEEALQWVVMRAVIISLMQQPHRQSHAIEIE